MRQKRYLKIVPFAAVTLLAMMMIFFIRFLNARLAATELGLAVGSVVLGLAVLGVGSLFLIRTKEITENHIALIVFIGFLFRIIFLIFIPATFFQNDMGAFEQGNYGNLGYVYMMYSTGKLPALNPMEHYQFYHPPLHFAISALYLKCLSVIGINLQYSAPIYLRLLPLLYCTGTIIVIDKLAKELGISTDGRMVIAGISSFLPYQIFLSGALNNDPLMLLFCMLAFYYTVHWYRKSTYPTIIKMALSIGLAMNTKISAALIAPGIGVLMLWKLWEHREAWLKYVKQFAVFALIVFPIGMWYAILRFVQYRMPLTYAPTLPDDSIQKISHYSVLQRFFDFSNGFSVLHIQWDRNQPYTDHNIFVALIKYAVFGESNFDAAATTIHFVSGIMIAATVVLFTVIAAGVVFFIRDKKVDLPIKSMFIITVGLSFVMYIKFCFDFPFICAMSIRYILVAFYLCLIAFGWECKTEYTNLEKNSSKKRMISGRLVQFGILLYVTISIVMLFNLAVCC